jgi:hypothetical protein
MSVPHDQHTARLAVGRCFDTVRSRRRPPDDHALCPTWNQGRVLPRRRGQSANSTSSARRVVRMPRPNRAICTTRRRWPSATSSTTPCTPRNGPTPTMGALHQHRDGVERATARHEPRRNALVVNGWAHVEPLAERPTTSTTPRHLSRRTRRSGQVERSSRAACCSERAWTASTNQRDDMGQ